VVIKVAAVMVGRVGEDTQDSFFYLLIFCLMLGSGYLRQC